MAFARTIGLATAVAGTLDILSAFAVGGLAGRSPFAVLTSVASGPLGRRVAEWGLLGPAIGLAVHFSIMAVMAAAFLWAALTFPALSNHPVPAGLFYGLILYGVMYWLVLPARWPTVFPQTGWWDVSNALFSHLLCVGLPLGLIAWSAEARRSGELPSGMPTRILSR